MASATTAGVMIATYRAPRAGPRRLHHLAARMPASEALVADSAATPPPIDRLAPARSLSSEGAPAMHTQS